MVGLHNHQNSISHCSFLQSCLDSEFYICSICNGKGTSLGDSWIGQLWRSVSYPQNYPHGVREEWYRANPAFRGLEADQKVIAVHGCYAMTTTTALTAQNTLGVVDIHQIPPEFVQKSIDACISDIGVDVVKTGMVFFPVLLCCFR